MLARQAGVSASALSQIESGQVSPSIATLEKICAALELPITILFDEPVNGSDPLVMPAQNRRRVPTQRSNPLRGGFPKKKCSRSS
jgi:transcriptional regulator with XRE-family HTH domain